MMTFTDDLDQRQPSPFPLAAATALLAAAILGIGFLLMQRDTGGAVDGAVPGDAAAPAAVTQDTASRVNAPTGPRAAEQVDRAARSARDGGAISVYVAGSPEAAEHARARMHEADAVRLSLGLPPLNVVVVVAGSEEESLVLRLVAEAEAIRGTLGVSLPAITVIELRDP